MEHGEESFCPPMTVADVIQGIQERGVLHECDGVLSGYMGDASLGEVILDAVAASQKRQSRRRLLLRPGDGRYWPRIFCAPGYSRIHA